MPVEHNPPTPVDERERAAVERALRRMGFGEAPPQRSALLGLLHALQEEQGWLSRGALAHLAERAGLPFPDVWGVASFYALFRLEPPRGEPVHVCDDVPCRLRGADDLLAALAERYGPPRRFTGRAHGPGAERGPGPSLIDWETVSCLGRCDEAPAALVGDAPLGRATLDGIVAAARQAAARRSGGTPATGTSAAETPGAGDGEPNA